MSTVYSLIALATLVPLFAVSVRRTPGNDIAFWAAVAIGMAGAAGMAGARLSADRGTPASRSPCGSAWRSPWGSMR